MLVVFWDLIKCLPVILKMIQEIRSEIDRANENISVKERVNELREINKVKDVKALNINLNGG